MTPLQRVRRARALLVTSLAISTALWSVATAAAVLALASAAGALGLLPPGGARLVGPAAALAGLASAMLVLWKQRSVRSVELVALWLEERAPALKYALVTTVDPRFAAAAAGDAGYASLRGAAGRADLEGIARRAAGRMVARAAGSCAAAVGALAILWSYAPVSAYADPAGRTARPKELANRLAGLRAEVVPPAYSGLPRRTISDPTNVPGLVGTRIGFLGAGPPEGVTAVLAKDTLAAAPGDDGWTIPLMMPKAPAALRFHDRAYHRLVVLEPLPDSAPRVVLRLPASDTTYRFPPKGQLVLETEVEDDYGLDYGLFELLLSTGETEGNYQTKTILGARLPLQGKRAGQLRSVISFDTLRLGPGHVLHVRAVAYDRNNVTGPGKGVSETRTLRVATPQEYDSVSITAASPLPIDTLFVSQRLLNMRTDTLIRLRRPRISQAEYIDTSVNYGATQEDIRQRVEKVIAILEDDGVGGRSQTEPSKLLREASEQMWQGRGLLGIGQPDSALTPYMKEALRLLDEARKAQRYYIRGLLRTRPVNLARVRLQGQEEANAGRRTPREIPEDLRRELRERLVAVTPAATASPRSAVDALMLIRVVALRGAPAVAEALQQAVDAAREGASPATALARAQRLLDPPPRVTTGPAEWGGGLLP